VQIPRRHCSRCRHSVAAAAAPLIRFQRRVRAYGGCRRPWCLPQRLDIHAIIPHPPEYHAWYSCRAVGASNALLWSALVQPTCDANCQLSAWSNNVNCAYDSVSNSYQQQQLRTVLAAPVGVGAACDAVSRCVLHRHLRHFCSCLVSAHRREADGLHRGCHDLLHSPVRAGVHYQRDAGSVQISGSQLLSWSVPTVPAPAANPCGETLSIANGAVSSGGKGTTGSSVVFSCASGYVLSDSLATWSCNASGAWTSSFPTARPRCVASTCPTLQPPANGYLITSTQPNDLVIDFACLSGYTISAQHETYKCHIPTGKLTPADQPSHPLRTCTQNGGAGAARRLLSKLLK